MPAEILKSLYWMGPEVILVGFLVVIFLCDGLMPKTRENFVPLYLTVVGCGLAALMTWKLGGERSVFFSGLVANDGLTELFRYVFFFSAAAGLYLSYGSKELETKSRVEFSLLLLCVTFGLSLMAISTHFLMLYIGIETVSIISFVMAGFNRDSLRSNEASFKYLMFGALSSGLMIYGFSLIYGYTGSLQYGEIAKHLQANAGNLPFAVTLALLMVYAGIAYKISAFPLHFWTPDVYEGAPTPVAAFFSIGPKAAGFAALIRVLLEVLSVKSPTGGWQPVAGTHLTEGLALVSVATMLVGNLSALGQTSVKRILAYSSIAHVGYMLMGLVTLQKDGIAAVLFYLVIYCLMNMGAFWVVSIVADAEGGDTLDKFRGMGWKTPVLGVCMAVFLFSLTGIPLFSGFIGKFLLFGAVLQVPGLLWLALIGVLNSVISLYYYAKILKVFWLDQPEAGGGTLTLSPYHAVGVIALAVPTVVLGLFFMPVLEFAQKSLAHFMG